MRSAPETTVPSSSVNDHPSGRMPFPSLDWHGSRDETGRGVGPGRRRRTGVVVVIAGGGATMAGGATTVVTGGGAITAVAVAVDAYWPSQRRRGGSVLSQRITADPGARGASARRGAGAAPGRCGAPGP